MSKTASPARRMAAIALAFSVLVMLSGCSDSVEPAGLNKAKRPLTVLANTKSGLMLLTADGQVLVYPGGYYFTAIALESGYKQGDVFIK